MAQRLDNRPAQLVGAGFGCVIVLIGLGGLASHDLTGLGYLAVGVGTVIRALRSSNVLVATDHVETRSMVRTRRYRYSELDSVEVVVGRTGMNGFGRQHLLFHFHDGTERRFTELNCKPPNDPAGVSVVQAAAAAITARLSGAEHA